MRNARLLSRSRKNILHDYRSERHEVSSITATEAKNEFGRILEKVMKGGMVVITRHDTAKAVLISVDQFSRRSPYRSAR